MFLMFPKIWEVQQRKQVTAPILCVFCLKRNVLCLCQLSLAHKSHLLAVRWRWAFSLSWWWRWQWTSDRFVPSGTILVHRIKYALSNEIYFLLLGFVIMLKSIFNILGSMLREVLFLHCFCQYSRVIMCNKWKIKGRYSGCGVGLPVSGCLSHSFSTHMLIFLFFMLY